MEEGNAAAMWPMNILSLVQLLSYTAIIMCVGKFVKAPVWSNAAAAAAVVKVVLISVCL